MSGIIFDRESCHKKDAEDAMKLILIEALPEVILVQLEIKWSARKMFLFVSKSSKEAQRTKYETIRNELDTIQPASLAEVKMFTTRFNELLMILKTYKEKFTKTNLRRIIFQKLKGKSCFDAFVNRDHPYGEDFDLKKFLMNLDRFSETMLTQLNERTNANPTVFAAMVSNIPNNQPGSQKCSHCGMVGHSTNKCRFPRLSNESMEVYWKRRHSERTRMHHQVPQSSPNNDTQILMQQVQELTKQINALQTIKNYSKRSAKVNVSVTDQDAKYKWIFDTGATNSFTNDIDDFLPGSFGPSNFDQVILGDGSTRPITGAGIVKIITPDGTYEIDEVQLAPTLHYKLVSHNDLVKTGFNVILTPDGIYVNLEEKSVKIGNQCEKSKLIVMNILPKAQPSALITTRSRTSEQHGSLNFWHNTLNHRSPVMIQDAVKNQSMLGIKITDDSWNGCLTCELASIKQPAQHGINDLALSEQIGIVTADTCGPFSVASIGGERCFSTLTELSTRYTSIKLIHEKSSENIARHVEEFCVFINAHLSKPVYKLVSDYGKEYDSKLLRDTLLRLGITQEMVGPYSPEENGVAERLNGVLQTDVRASLLNAQLPMRFWGEALGHATHTRNRLPHSRLPSKITPYQAILKRPPTLNYLRPFGSYVIIKKHNMNGKGFEAQGVRGRLMGYGPNRSYRIFNLETNRIVEAHDIKFLDDNSPDIEQAFKVPTVHQASANIAVQFSTILDKRESDQEKEENDEIELVTNEALEPNTYQEALLLEQGEIWNSAVLDELKTLTDVTGALEVVDRVEGMKVLKSTMVIKAKRDADGKVYKRKARGCIKGYQQRYGIDYFDTFAPVVQYNSLLVMISMAASKNFLAHQIDFDSAFLNSNLSETIYMEAFPGFELGNNKVYQLRKAIYGLKQAPREWWKTLCVELNELEWTPLKSDICIFQRIVNDQEQYLSVYVDDILILAKTEEEIANIKTELSFKYKTKDLGEVNFLLGIRFGRNLENKTITLDQKALIQKSCDLYYNDLKRANTPYITSDTISESSKILSRKEYQERIGTLNYLALKTRPDILTATSICARKVHCFDLRDCLALKRIFQYLSATIDLKKIIDGRGDFKPKGYADANWAAPGDDSRSISGNLLYLGRNLISWSSKKQKSIAHSTMEAELVAAMETAKDLVWIHQFLDELKLTPELPLPMYSDNQAAIAQCTNWKSNSKIRHMDLRYKQISEWIEDGEIQIHKIETSKNLSDLMTKPLGKDRFLSLRNGLGLI